MLPRGIDLAGEVLTMAIPPRGSDLAGDIEFPRRIRVRVGAKRSLHIGIVCLEQQEVGSPPAPPSSFIRRPTDVDVDERRRCMVHVHACIN